MPTTRRGPGRPAGEPTGLGAQIRVQIAALHISAGTGGIVEIIDPPLVEKQLDFSVPPLLGYLENIVDTSRMIADDIFTGKVALLCNYIAAGFPSAEDSHALTVPSETAHSTSPQLTLTTPHTK
jgi:hypothetical protein